MNEQALVQVDPNQALIAAAAQDFSEDLVLKPSYLELVQPINALDGAIAGNYRDKDSGMQFDKMDVVILAQKRQRTFWRPGGDLGEDPLCRSLDAKFPILDNPALVPQAKSCETCEHASWKSYDAKTKTGIPQCKESRRLLLVNRETGLVYFFTAKKKALKPVNTFLATLLKFQKISEANQKMGKGTYVPHYGFVTEMSAQKIVGAKGTFFVPKFGVPKVISDPTEFGALYVKYVQRHNVLDSEEVATEAVNDAVEGEYIDA